MIDRSSPSSHLLYVLVCSLLMLGQLGKCKIICDVENYVFSGLEFAKCNQATMDAFPSTPLNMDPCPVLDHIVNSCALILKPCYDERGKNECNVFDKENNDNAQHPQIIAGEKCTINEEVELMQEMRGCSANSQSQVLTDLINSHSVNQDSVFSEIICNGLATISKKCYTDKLVSCYDESDAQFHLAFLLEELRLAGITFVSHLTPTNRSEPDRMNVDDCPVFRDGPLAVFKSHQETYFSKANKTNSTVIMLSVLLTVVILVGLAITAYFVVTKSRLVPIIRARFENSPYTDFSSEPTAPVRDPGSSVPKPSFQTMSMVIQNETNSTSNEGPST